jgi:Tfp pilus assembly protein PilF
LRDEDGMTTDAVRRLAVAVAAAAAVGAGLGAAPPQVWRGMGRVAGKVVDERGAPLEGVAVVAVFPDAGGRVDARTNKKGEWAIGGIARGEWQLDFVKDGYETYRTSVFVNELTRLPPLTVTLKRAAPAVDPNAEIAAGLQQASSLMNRKQYAEARAIYEGLLAKYPQVHQLHPLIARTYYGENRYDEAIAHLKRALEAAPDSVEVKLLLGNVLVEKGDAAAGQALLATIDDRQVKDPTTFLNVGIVLFNQGKSAEALAYFEKDVALFPDYPDAYYYRGITHLQLGHLDLAKADLQKFVAMAPEAPEAATAKKILDQLKDRVG